MPKHFVGKAFEPIIERENLYSVVVENVAAETNDFFQAFPLLLTAFNVFNIEQHKQLETFLFFQKFLLFL